MTVAAIAQIGVRVMVVGMILVMAGLAMILPQVAWEIWTGK